MMEALGLVRAAVDEATRARIAVGGQKEMIIDIAVEPAAAVCHAR